MKLFLTLSLLLLKFATVFSEKDKPTMAVEVFRHGARTLIHQPSDFFNFDEPESLLPSGQRQQYNLGRLIAKKYEHLLQSNDPKYIYTRSSEPIRCVMSLHAHMVGVFAGKVQNISERAPLEEAIPVFYDKELVNQTITSSPKNLQAIPNGFLPNKYFVKSALQEDMLHVAPWNCKYVDNQQHNRMFDGKGQEIVLYLYQTMMRLRQRGYNILSLANLAHFGESLALMHLEGRDKELPQDFRYGSRFYDDTNFANEWYSTYYFVGGQLERAIKVHNLMAQILEWFQGAANGTSTLKFAFLSGHETSYLSLLNFYGIFNDVCLFENYQAKRNGEEIPHPDCIFPEYSSQVIYEFYNGTETEEPYVKFLYNGKPFKICNESAGVECKLSEFIRETQNMLLNISSKDVESYCKFEDPVSYPGTLGKLGVSIESLVFSLISAMFTLIAYKLAIQKKMRFAAKESKAVNVSNQIDSIEINSQ